MDTTNTTPISASDTLVEQSEVIVQDTNELAELTANSIQRFSPEVQAQIRRVADEIDPLQIDKILAYGSSPLIRTYDASGQILKQAEGTSIDREVIEQVRELAKLASKGQEEVNLSLKEPNFLEKLLLNIFTSFKDKKDAETEIKAISCYKLLVQLLEKCEVWHSMLQENWRLICQAIQDDMQNGIELEQYIVAAHVAMPRLQAALEERELLAKEQGLIADKADYDNYKKGMDTFAITLLNLEKSRAAYGLSLGQLSVQKTTNENIQIAVVTQKRHSMAVASQQLRNALLEARNRQVLEGQRSIAALNGELMKHVSSNTILTAEESERLLTNGVYAVQAALEAAKTVVEGCQAIEKAHEELLPNANKQMTEIRSLLEQVTPFVDSVRQASEAQGKGTTTPKNGLSF